MFRQVFGHRLQLPCIVQQCSNVQWVPTVQEVCTAFCTTSPEHFSRANGSLKNVIDIPEQQHNPHAGSAPESTSVLQHQQQSPSSHTPAHNRSHESCTPPSSTDQGRERCCNGVVSLVHAQRCRGYCNSTSVVITGSSSSSSSSRRTPDQPSHLQADTHSASIQHLRNFQAAGCKTSVNPQMVFQTHLSTCTSNHAAIQQSWHDCSSQPYEQGSNQPDAAGHSPSSSNSSSGTGVNHHKHNSVNQHQQASDQGDGPLNASITTDTGSDSTSSSSRRSHRARSKQQQQQQQHTDLRSPASWYPLARAMQRQLIAHVGPTNSGKTHAALSALMAAPSGVYCGPLRLLACEIADRLNAAGVPCNLVTGQEVRMVRGARHTACTVEMADLDQRVEVAVLDEIQMISDKSRGWSWTRALLGLPAHSIHVCGDSAATDLLSQLAQHCNDPLTVNRYRRLSPLIVEPRALDGVQAVLEGDCVVAFGRKALHKLRKNILATNLKGTPRDSSDSGFDSSSESDRSGRRQGVGMVYGALPPEARRTQAALFNAGAGHWPRYSVMVASDAIGMGLNLNIRRIVFASMHKYDGEELRPLTPSEVKQIAGRAGRYGSTHGAAGYVTCLNQDDLPLLREALGTASTQNTHACLLPRFEQLEQYLHSLKHPLPFHKVLNRFAAAAQLSGPYFLADMSNMVSLARVLSHLEGDMDLEEMYTWCISPASADDPAVLQALLTFATLYVDHRRVTPECITTQIPAPPRTAAEMKAAEELFRVYDLYLWLGGRAGPGVFQGRKVIRQQRQQVAELINVALQEMGGVMDSTDWQATATGRGAKRAGRREKWRRGSMSSRVTSSCSEDDEAEVVGAYSLGCYSL